MGEQGDLGLEETRRPELANAPAAGLLVTNHLNLMYMLAAGLVMPPAGFGDKYYADMLGTFPGWIPLFIDSLGQDAIDLAASEAEHLRPIIVQFDLSRLSGQVMAMSADGVECREFRDGVSGLDRVILVPAPLPVSWIDFISFRTKDEKRECEADAEDHDNVALTEFKRYINKNRLFTKVVSEPWPLSSWSAEHRSVPLEQPLAAGGVMAVLQRFANLGDHAVHACRTAFDACVGAPQPVEDHPLLAGLGDWTAKGEASPPMPPDAGQDRTALQNASQARLFWECVNRLVAWRAGEERRGAEEVLHDYLAEVTKDPDERSLEWVGKLKDALDSLTGLGDATTGELFERHDAPLARALTLFFLRRDCSDLVEFANDRLSELDWLAAAILFGVRDGWMKLPLDLRGNRTFSDSVCHRMAQMSHRLAGSGIDLGESPPRVRPLREMLRDPESWKAREKSAALELARSQKWDCVHTSINLRPGEYRMIVKGGGLSIEVPGEPRISPEVDSDRFLGLLTGTRLDFRTEAKIRKHLGR